MKIKLKEDAKSGDLEIPKGEYMVTLLSELSQINLSGGGRDYKITARKRRAIARAKTTTVSFFCGGGVQWSLVVSTPKYGEWISLIEYKNKVR